MILQKSSVRDVEALTVISTKAFDTDVSVGGPENDGPPGYDSPEWHAKTAEEGHLYSYFNDDSILVGGAVLFGKKELYVGRIFIDPQYFRQGYGISLMKDIEKMFGAETIKLDTPVWNVRTNRFYQKCGYTETGRDDESVYYEKVIK